MEINSIIFSRSAGANCSSFDIGALGIPLFELIGGHGCECHPHRQGGTCMRSFVYSTNSGLKYPNCPIRPSVNLPGLNHASAASRVSNDSALPPDGGVASV